MKTNNKNYLPLKKLFFNGHMGPKVKTMHNKKKKMYILTFIHLHFGRYIEIIGYVRPSARPPTSDFRQSFLCDYFSQKTWAYLIKKYFIVKFYIRLKEFKLPFWRLFYLDHRFTENREGSGSDGDLLISVHCFSRVMDVSMP